MENAAALKAEADSLRQKKALSEEAAMLRAKKAKAQGATPVAEHYPAPVSALVGSGRGFSAGFSDEMSGAAAVASKFLNPFDKVESAGQGLGAVSQEILDTYREGRGQARTMGKQMDAEDPLASNLGKVQGGVALGLAAPTSAIKGLTGFGAAYGLGESEADLTKGEIGQAAIDTGEGAAKGLVFGGAMLGGMKAASAIARPIKKIAAPLANWGFNKAAGATRQVMGPEAIEGMKKYFGMAAPTAKAGTMSPEQRVVMFQALMKKHGGNSKAALEEMAGIIMAPVNEVTEAATKMRGTQEMLWKRAIRSFREQGNMKAAEALEAAGPRSFSHPEVQTPPPIATPLEQFEQRWYEIKQLLGPGGRFSAAGKQVVDDVEGALERGRAPLDDLLNLKTNLNEYQFAPSGAEKAGVPPAVRHGVRLLRGMIDDAIEASAPAGGENIIRANREYAQFADAFPKELRSVADQITYNANFGSMVGLAGAGGSSGAIGTGLAAGMGIGGPGLALAGGASAIGGIVIRTATSRPVIFMKMAAYAAKNGSPQIAPFFNEAAQVGLPNATERWAMMFPAAWPSLSQALPKVAMEAFRSSAELKAELRQAIKEDESLSDAEKSRMIEDVNTGKAFSSNSEGAQNPPDLPPQGPGPMGPGMMGIP